ncbi:MAG TPA: DUF1080 domain-containing protein [Bacteroidales bacterium]|nr:DUF1080 domain-containing protein [Bacteroidales bacterium]
MKKVNILLGASLIAGVALFFSCKSSTSGNSDSAAADSAAADTLKAAEPAPNTLTDAEKSEGWTLLFDGTSTTGWRGYAKTAFPDSGWEVVDGTLHCIGSGTGEAGNGGDVIYDKKFKDFELTLEWKISEGGNSGIFYLAQEKKDAPIWKSAPEMQILDNAKHPDAKLGKDGNRQAGSLYDLIPAVPQNAKPAGEWNKVNIMVYQGTVVHYMNGEKVLEYHLWTDDWKKMINESKFKGWNDFLNAGGKDKQGYIGLQDHGNDVWFRNIKIKVL